MGCREGKEGAGRPVSENTQAIDDGGLHARGNSGVNNIRASADRTAERKEVW